MLYGPSKASVLYLKKVILTTEYVYPVMIWVLIFFQYNGADTEICIPTTWNTKRIIPWFISKLYSLYSFPGCGFYHIWTYETILAPQLIFFFRRLSCKTTLWVLKFYWWVNYLKFKKKAICYCGTAAVWHFYLPKCGLFPGVKPGDRSK